MCSEPLWLRSQFQENLSLSSFIESDICTYATRDRDERINTFRMTARTRQLTVFPVWECSGFSRYEGDSVHVRVSGAVNPRRNRTVHKLGEGTQENPPKGEHHVARD